MNQLVLENYRRQPGALHMEQVVVEADLANWDNGQQRNSADYANNNPGTPKPGILDPCASPRFNGFAAIQHRLEFMIENVLLAAQQQNWQQGHHWNKADDHASATDNAHLLDAFEIGRGHREKSAGGRESSRENAHPCVHHGFFQRV